jgi:tryptophanyl-tRNA synthetase
MGGSRRPAGREIEPRSDPARIDGGPPGAGRVGAAERVFSGIQPSGGLHIGNYLGAIRNWVDQQRRYDSIFCIVDLHAITVPQDPVELRRAIRELAMILLAAGLHPAHATLFVQSEVPAHSEAAWLLNCVTPVGWLERMTQFRDRTRRQPDRERISAGLLDYPVLMAADILLYQTRWVPVGEDQRQHVELTRDIAVRFNNLFGATFVIPEAQIREIGARIMGLDDPTRKMSKSERDPDHAIFLLDSPETIRKKLARAATDSRRDVAFDPTRPGLHNLLTIYQMFSGESPDTIESRYHGKGYAELKRELADVVIEGLRPLQAEYQRLADHPDHVDAILRRGAMRAAGIAGTTLARMHARMGLGASASPGHVPTSDCA